MTRTKPPSSPASMARARPMAAKGKTDWITSSRPSTSCGPRPAETISGSVKQTAAMVTGSKTRSWPAMISATTSPWAEPLCASMGSPVRSPTAQTFFMLVAQRLSIFTNGPSMATPMVSRPQPLVRGRRPTVTSTLSASSCIGLPSLSVTFSLPSPKPPARAPRKSSTPCFSSHFCTGSVRALS
ncbi:hypothetical protein D3C80_1448240 [compost metagenome]